MTEEAGEGTMFGIWHTVCECWVRLKGCDLTLPNWLEDEIGDSILCYETEEKAEAALRFCFPRLASLYEVRPLERAE